MRGSSFCEWIPQLLKETLKIATKNAVWPQAPAFKHSFLSPSTRRFPTSVRELLSLSSVFLAGMVALRSTAVNYSAVGEKPYDLVYGGLWKACIVKGGKERCEALLVGQGGCSTF